MFLEGLLNDYFIFLFFLGFVVTLSFILFILSYFLVADDVYFEKISAYECGFEPFEDTRVKFDVRFYLVGILFLVFDIEVMFVYPWVACFSLHTSLSFVTMFFFFAYFGGWFCIWMTKGCFRLILAKYFVLMFD